MTDEKSMMFMKIVGKATLAPDISGGGDEGGRVLSFQEKRKNQRKADWLFSRMAYLIQALLEGYIREAAPLSCDACFAQSQRRLLLALFVAHACYNLT